MGSKARYFLKASQNRMVTVMETIRGSG